MWFAFGALLRHYYLRYKANIKKGEMWVLRMGYTFCYGVMIRIHESIFGLMCYGFLMQFTYLNFTTVLSIFSFIAAVLLLAYIVVNTVNLYDKMNGNN
jgi:hypothetical protein